MHVVDVVSFEHEHAAGRALVHLVGVHRFHQNHELAARVRCDAVDRSHDALVHLLAVYHFAAAPQVIRKAVWHRKGTEHFPEEVEGGDHGKAAIGQGGHGCCSKVTTQPNRFSGFCPAPCGPQARLLRCPLMTKKAKLFAGFCLLLILGAVVGGVVYSQRDVVPEMTTETVKRGDVTETVDLTGYLQKSETLQLAFIASGEVVDLPEVGDVVKKGGVLATIEFMDEDVDMKSPINGLVTAVNAHVGETASAGMPVITIESADDDFSVLTYAAESDVTKLDVGQEATMTLDAFGDDAEFTGEVMSIAPSATLIEGVPYFAVEISLDEEVDGGKGEFEGLRTGMSVDIAVQTKKIAGVLFIPSRAVITKDDEKYVRIPDETNENHYVERQVTVGDRGDNGLIVVKSGVREGDTVILKIEE